MQVKGMGRRRGNGSDVPLPHTVQCGGLKSQALVGCEGKGHELRTHLSILGASIPWALSCRVSWPPSKYSLSWA